MWRYASSLLVVAVVAVGASAAVTLLLPTVLPASATPAPVSDPTALGGGSRAAAVPQTINHQGVVSVNGVPFTGTGTFYFAIIDPDNPSTSNRWTNDGSHVDPADSQAPNRGVAVPVTNGIYSVRLGDTTAGYGYDPNDASNTADMVAIPPVIFSENSHLKLRIWFNDRSHGVHELTPPQPLCSAPYAFSASNGVPIGTIVAWHKSMTGVPALPDNWIECTNPTNALTITDTESPMSGQVIPDLNSTPSGYTGGGLFLRGGTTSGSPADGGRQEATKIYNGPGSACGAIAYPYPFNASADGGTSYASTNRATLTQFGSCNVAGTFSFVRPVNMSVVWIMRIK